MADKLRLKQITQDGALDGQALTWSNSLSQWTGKGPAIATWTGIRYFAVDYDSGSDSNVGFSDTSLADAGTKALKTIEQFRNIFPKFGNGQVAVIAIKPRSGGATYRNIADTADDDFTIRGLYGYFKLIIRGTDTVASASSVAFANDTADKICAGGRIFPGTNAAGYNPTGSPTTSVFTCQLAGGGAPGLTAEPALIGKRIRFDSATTTAALRNACSMVWANTSTQITTSSNLPATPSTSDVFYIEEPNVAIGRMVIHTSNPSNEQQFTQVGIQIVGIRATSSTSPVMTMRGPVALANFSFVDIPGSPASFSAAAATGALDLRFTNTYTDELDTPATITTGTGIRCEGGITPSTCGNVTIAHSTSIQARFQVLAAYQFTIGAGCYSTLGALVQGNANGVSTTSVGGNIIGNAGSATVRRFRTTGTFTESIALSRSNATIYGCDISGLGATPGIKINGVGLQIVLHDVVGSTGNTDVGVDITLGRDCRVLAGTLAANTVTGTLGDIRAAGPVFYAHADYTRTDLRDANGNHIQGSGLSIVGPTTLYTNDGNANIGQYAITRSTGSGTVRAAKADTASNVIGIAGISQSAFTSAGPQNAMHVDAGASWIQFDGAPTIGNSAYISSTNAGNAQDTPPAVTGSLQRVNLGVIAKASGTLGLVALHHLNESLTPTLVGMSERIFRSFLSLSGTPLLLISGTAYFVYVGRVIRTCTPQFVEVQTTTIAAGAQTAELGIFSSPTAPSKAAQTLTKLEATGTIGSLTATGVQRNTSAFSTSVPAGTHLWAGMRTAMATTQPTVFGLFGDMSEGHILTLAGSGALTAASTFSGSLVAVSTATTSPALRVTMD